MRKFIDERYPDKVITEKELYQEFLELQKEDNDSYQYTFCDFIKNCTDKNGTLTEIKTKE